MPAAQPLLLELFTEELPPKALNRLGQAFAEGIAAGLKSRGLLADGSTTTAYATPRRLAVHLSAVLPQGADSEFSEKLMPVGVGLDANGQPTPALQRSSRPRAWRASTSPDSRASRTARTNSSSTAASPRARRWRPPCRRRWKTRWASCPFPRS